jgi:hypothetical protein
MSLKGVVKESSSYDLKIFLMSIILEAIDNEMVLSFCVK